jgi:photosystem II stability/assembly factor-like uncharacterized protein
MPEAMQELRCGALTDLVEVFLVGGINSDDDAAIWRSTDFGDTWTQVLSVAHTGAFEEMETPTDNDSRIVAITEGGKFFLSIDRGINWTEVLDASNEVNALDFFDSGNIGIAVSRKKVYRTLDQGSTWQEIATGSPRNLNDVHCIGDGLSDQIAVAVGFGGTIIRSIDGGLTWTVQNPTTNDLYAVAFSENSGGRYGLILGDLRRLTSTDDGETWVSGGFFVGGAIDDLLVSSGGNCIVSFGEVRFSSDRGVNWSGIKASIEAPNLISRQTYDGAGYVFCVGQ